MTRRALAALFICAAMLAACVEGTDFPNEPIVSHIPWAPTEGYSYVLVNQDQEEQGRGTISIQPAGEGRSLIRQSFSDEDGNADESLLIVDADTLLPVAGERDIVDADGDRRVVALTEYGPLDDGDHGVRIAQLTYDPRSEAEPSNLRCNPLKVEDFAYDNDSSLYLWRTIPFEEGYTVNFTDVIANRRNQVVLTLRVRGQERVETPAGEFDAWLVTISGAGRETQQAWFATTDDHRLLVYNNGEDQILLLTGEAPPDGDASMPEPLPQECRGET